MINTHTLLDYGIQVGLIDAFDALYINNQLALFTGLSPQPYTPSNNAVHLGEILEHLTQEALQRGRIEVGEEEHYQAALMNYLTPSPSQVRDEFFTLHAQDSKAATDAFFQLMTRNGYIQEAAVKRNRHFSVPSVYGNIQCTINLSKPEKDPKVIAKLKDQKAHSYPLGMLAKENMGYYGHLGYPGRSNHRIIPLSLNQEPFYLQYSPYVYYEEHVIVFHEAFIPMEISEKTWHRLFDFVDLFPHYFLGSNAGLPIVGGSILNHEHYQGGKARFPIEQAAAFASYETQGITIDLLKWPVSVCKISSHHRTSLIHFVESLRQYYEGYSDPTVDLIAQTDASHNAINPIVRKEKDRYVVLMAFRNNRTTEDYPDGLFHVHPDVYPIKKENIGLIEVMGLAILPPRHQNAIESMVAYAKGEVTDYDQRELYESWAQSFDVAPERTATSIEQAMGKTFVKGLEDVGVFKQTSQGQTAFKRFIEGFLKTKNT